MLNIRTKKAIIWDWNGTLLNDTEICVECINVLLQRRGLTKLSLKNYTQIFTFPVKDYYEKAGFNFSNEPFEIPAMEFIDLYHQNLPKAGLFPCVDEILPFMKIKGLNQSVLSAMEHDSLIKSLNDNDIAGYFDEISGIDNYYAHSKLENGRDLLKRIDMPVKDILLIGDSLHDFEVAEKLGIDCLLVANGHQSRERLLAQTQNVFDQLKEVIPLFE